MIELRGKALMGIILLTSGLDFLLFGFDQGLIGGILGGERFKETLGYPLPSEPLPSPKYLGYSQSMSLILASVAFTQYAIFSWPPYLYIDRIGRRWSVMGSSAGCAVCMLVIAGCLSVQSYSTAAAAVAFMFLYLDCFTLGILPVSWSYSAEIQPLNVRNKATVVGVFSHWMLNFVVVMVTPIGLSSIGGKFFFVWGVVCASFIPLTYFFGVETSGRTLEQVDTMFYENPRVMMGLNPENRRVIRSTVADEEERYKTFAHAKGGNESVEKMSI
ncbi:hypothetical protein KVT40_009080 [Elsinoe batatas]|uniref:Major facilitator superfamily (MFS) profile domain-containing protein n=1 Tax=Elsinoe batatas TaxID=2601811 RepID=A0A8K0PG08_9PEZI|nr:hypothetical protein KVT40_009080 [Elsinoe batatas]